MTEEVKYSKLMSRLYKQLTQTARFAIPDDFELDEEYDDVLTADWKEYGDEDGSLEELVYFQGPDFSHHNAPGNSGDEL